MSYAYIYKMESRINIKHIMKHIEMSIQLVSGESFPST